MCAQTIEDQGTITLSQMDYLPILIESFLIDRKAQGLSSETIRFYKKKMKSPPSRNCSNCWLFPAVL